MTDTSGSSESGLNRKVYTYESDLTLQSGTRLPGAKLVFATYGTLNSSKSNAVLYPTRFGATHTENEFLIGPGMAIDPDKYFIIIPNLFGNGLSSSPSNTAAEFKADRFPPISIYDAVVIQQRMIRELFDIERFAAAVGWSMGGQQAYQWASLFPDSVQRLAVICGTARTSDHNKVFLKSIRAAIRADHRYSDRVLNLPPTDGLRAAGRIYAGWAYSQDWYREHQHLSMGYVDLEAYLCGYWDALFEKRDADNIMAMTWTWINNDISANGQHNGDFARSLQAISATTLLMPCDRDLYFRTADSQIEMRSLKRAKLVEIESSWGHMSGSGQSQPDTDFIDKHLRLLLADALL